MFRSSHSNPRRVGRSTPGVALLGLVLCAAPSWARSSLPKGFSAGPFVVAPYLATSMGYDDNLFRVHECDPAVPGCIGPQAETFTRTTLGLAARMPVRNSWLDLRYQVDKREYDGYAPQRPREQTGGAQFRFNFGSGDSLIVDDTYTRGASDVKIVDEGGELVYRDAPFDYNRAEVAWQRAVPGRAGFTVRVARVDLQFEPDPTVPFFNYSGWETALEYRHPVPGRRWLRLYYDARRFDNFEAGVDHSTTELFRKEESDSLQAGVVGFVGRDHPFDVRVGYGKFRLVSTGAEHNGVVGPANVTLSEYNGLVGLANVTLNLGGRTWLNAVLWRRPLPSNFDTYYIVNSLRVSVERNLVRNLKAGIGVEHSRNGYLDPLPIDEDQLIREDQRYLWEGYLDWSVHPQLAVRLTAGRQQRDSNFRQAEYSATGAALGLRLGWF